MVKFGRLGRPIGPWNSNPAIWSPFREWFLIHIKYRWRDRGAASVSNEFSRYSQALRAGFNGVEATPSDRLAARAGIVQDYPQKWREFDEYTIASPVRRRI